MSNEKYFKNHFGKEFTKGKLDPLACVEEIVSKDMCILRDSTDKCVNEISLLNHCLF